LKFIKSDDRVVVMSMHEGQWECMDRKAPPYHSYRWGFSVTVMLLYIDWRAPGYSLIRGFMGKEKCPLAQGEFSAVFIYKCHVN